MTVFWVFAGLGVIPALVAARAYLIERREGLVRSKLRAIGALALALAMFGLAWYTNHPVATPEPPRAQRLDATHDPRIARLRQELSVLESQYDALTAEILRRRDELAAIVPPGQLSAPSPQRTALPPSLPRDWLTYVALALLIAEILMLFVGDLSTLLPRGPAARRRSADGTEPATLAQVAEHAWAERWSGGLATIDRIELEQLSKLEVLDLLFLRALCNTMLAYTSDDATGRLSRDARTEKLTAAGNDVVRLLELAPHMAEAIWLHGYIKAGTGEWQPALDLFRRTRGELEGLAFDHNESVCLLHVAEAHMAGADNEAATRAFDEVVKLKVLTSHVPMVMVTHRILKVRGYIKGDRLSEASDDIEHVRRVEGLDDDTQRSVAAACDVYELAIRHRSGKLAEALDGTVALLTRWQPDKLPSVEDQIADEFLFPAIDPGALRMPAELYRALYFLEAVLRVELAARRGRPLDPDTVDAIAVALLRALQFEPRQRDALAALAALYIAYHKERTERALEWLEAAVTLGVRSRKARTLFLETRRAENERRDLLATFRSASARFLSDPTLGLQVRSALIEELGRFDEFRPVILDLQDSGALDLASSGEMTIGGLHERASFVASVAAEIAHHLNGSTTGKLLELHSELDALTASVDASAKRITAIERTIMEQLGHIVLR